MQLESDNWFKTEYALVQSLSLLNPCSKVTGLETSPSSTKKQHILRMKKITVFAILLFVPSAVLPQHTVYPGTFTISLGIYTDWNDRAVACDDIEFITETNCELDNDENRVVGDNTSSASTADELKILIEGIEAIHGFHGFWFRCLDKAAVFADIGQYVYPEEGSYGGPLQQFFEEEANRCWNHYSDIFEQNKDKF